MNMHFPEVDEHYIKAKIAAGCYTSETDLVRDAVRHMREEEERRERFKEAVRLGDQEIERGNTTPFTHERMEHITHEAREMARNGEKPSDDVCP